MKNKKNLIFSLTVCLLSGCLLYGCEKPDVEQTVSVSDATEGAVIGETEPETMPAETTSEETIAATAEETPEFTVWDGSGEFRKLGEHRLALRQYKDGKAYRGVDLPLVERTSGKYPGKARAFYFYMTDDMLYYLEQDETPFEYVPESMRLFAQTLPGDGNNVKLLDENVASAVYRDGRITTKGTDNIYKQIDVSTGQILWECDMNGVRDDLSKVAYSVDYALVYARFGGDNFYYDFATASKTPADISVHYPKRLWFWEGNVFSEKKNEDGTISITQLYEQREPVWRIFPQKLPGGLRFSNGKIFYCDKEAGIVMEYDLENNQLRQVCELEDDEYSEGKKRMMTSILYDNGAVFITESNSHTMPPNTFWYCVEPNGNKILLQSGYRN